MTYSLRVKQPPTVIRDWPAIKRTKLYTRALKCFCCKPNEELDEARSEPVNNNKNTQKIVKIMPITGCSAVRPFRGVTANLNSEL